MQSTVNELLTEMKTKSAINDLPRFTCRKYSKEYVHFIQLSRCTSTGTYCNLNVIAR